MLLYNYASGHAAQSENIGKEILTNYFVMWGFLFVYSTFNKPLTEV